MIKTILVFICLLLTVFLPSVSEAQQPMKVPRLGFVTAATLSSIVARVEAFRLGLRELGYVEGENIVIEYRYADGQVDRLRDLAAELVRLKVDLIVTAGPSATRSAKPSNGYDSHL